MNEIANQQELLKQVGQLANSVLSDLSISDEINYLRKKLRITERQIIASWLLWDTAIREYGNEVYTSEALRLVMHLHNKLPGSWHEKRQRKVIDWLQSISPTAICEVGFGVPQRYVHQYLNTRVKLFLGDFDRSSIGFAHELLQSWNPEYQHHVTLAFFDLNTDKLPPGYSVVIFQDSIEHASTPTAILEKFVASSASNTYFIFTLPIEVEKPIPEHNIVWKDEEEVLDWLKDAGLDILDKSTITMNPAVDLFSRSLHPDFREIAVLARKT